MMCSPHSYIWCPDLDKKKKFQVTQRCMERKSDKVKNVEIKKKTKTKDVSSITSA